MSSKRCDSSPHKQCLPRTGSAALGRGHRDLRRALTGDHNGPGLTASAGYAVRPVPAARRPRQADLRDRHSAHGTGSQRRRCRRGFRGATARRLCPGAIRTTAWSADTGGAKLRKSECASGRHRIGPCVSGASGNSRCVRTVSHPPRDPGETPSFTGTRRRTSM